MAKRERTIESFMRDDPERADALVFGRRTDVSRRGFLGGAGLAAMSAAVGGPIVFAASMPGGLIPAAFAQEAKKDAPRSAARRARRSSSFPARTQAWSCSATSRWWPRRPSSCWTTTPRRRRKFFIRNNGQIPEPASRRPTPGSSPSTARSTSRSRSRWATSRSASRPRPTAWCWNAAATAARSSRRRRAATSGPTAAPAARNGPACRSATC